MASTDQGIGRKRPLADPCSSHNLPKQHKVAPACSPSTTTRRSHIHPCSTSSMSSTHAPSSSHVASSLGHDGHSPTAAHRDSFSSSSSHSSKSSSTASPTSSDPFPRYALGIPHLDLLLPSSDGLDLLHAYHQGVGWMLSPVDRTTLLETLEEAQRHGADSIHPHRLACLLVALALGDLFSFCFPSSPSSSAHPIDSPSKRSRIWFGVASACLAGSRTHIELINQPTPDACSALYLMSTYLLCSNNEELYQRSQGLTGLALILAKSALVPSCIPSPRLHSTAHAPSPSRPAHLQAASDEVSAPAPPTSPASPSQSASLSRHNGMTNERLHCNRLLSDLIFHLRCQNLLFALPSSTNHANPSQTSPFLNGLPDVPTIHAIWTAFGTPLYASLDAFGNRYSPNIFHNWKLGLADLMHQVSCLTNQAMSLGQLASQTTIPCQASTEFINDNGAAHRTEKTGLTLPDHSQIVKLDERIRRYHASLPDFLLLHRPLPIEMAGKVDEDELAQIICQRHVACSLVHRMLMALHRPWFLSALARRSYTSGAKAAQKKNDRASADTVASLHPSPPSTNPALEKDDPESRTGAPESGEQSSASAMFSLSAVLRSATWQTETYASAAACAPPQALAWWQFTNNALAAAIVQATALLRLSCPLASASSSSNSGEAPTAQSPTPTSHFHNQVRNDLDKNICSFQNVAKRCKLAAKALPFLQRVSTAIDLGLCKSRSTDTHNQDALQSSITHQNTSNLESTSPPLTETLAQTRDKSRIESFICNNSSINGISHPSNSNSHSNSNNNSNSNSINSRNHTTSNIDRSNSIPEPQVHSPLNLASTSASNAAETRTEKQTQARPIGPRRASSTKSELEAIFGPIASGLELSKGLSASHDPIKPLYRQNFDPIPVAPTRTREGDEQSSLPSYIDDAGSSSSSSVYPHTPGSRSPHLDASTQLPKVKDAGKEDSSNESTTDRAMGKNRCQVSDLVLQCIRFWQPDLLSIPPEQNRT